MRITIEPTNEPKGEADCVPHKVVIEHPYDELSIVQVMWLWADALMAYGYSAKNISDWIEGEEPFKTDKQP